MGKTVIMNQEEMIASLDMRSVMNAVEHAYMYKSDSKAEVYPLIVKMYDNGGEFDIKSGECSGADIFGLKLVCGFPENVKKGLPRSNGIIVVYDFTTGLIQGIVDGVYITNIRTGAAGGVGVKYLARKDSEVLMILGAGRMAPAQAAATLECMDHIRKIIICNPRHPQKGEVLASELRETLKKGFVDIYQGTDHYDEMMKKIDIEYTAEADMAKACSQADIIITVTSSREALIRADWVKSGTHLSCIGADMPVKQEIDEHLLPKATVFADDIEQVTTVGECKIAYREGILPKENITEIGKVILKEHPGRTSAKEITLFDSTGIAIQDLLTAKAGILLAKAKGIAREIDL